MEKGPVTVDVVPVVIVRVAGMDRQLQADDLPALFCGPKQSGTSVVAARLPIPSGPNPLHVGATVEVAVVVYDVEIGVPRYEAQ